MQYITLACAVILAICLVVYVARFLRQYLSRCRAQWLEREGLQYEVRRARQASVVAFRCLPAPDAMRHDFREAVHPLPHGIRTPFQNEYESVRSATKTLVKRFEELNGKIICLKSSKISSAQYRMFRDEYDEITCSVVSEGARFDLLIAAMRSKQNALTVRGRKVRLCRINNQLQELGPLLDRLAARGINIRNEDSKVCVMRALASKLQGKISREETVTTFGKSHLKSLDEVDALESMTLDMQKVLLRKESSSVVMLVK